MNSTSLLAIPDPVEKANQAFVEQRNALADTILAGTSGLDLAQTLCRFTDQWLVTLWNYALPDKFSDRTSLHATGGYGRYELAFHSDIDVLIAVHDDSLTVDDEFELAIERLMAWSRHPRLRLSHAVRTAEQARHVVGEDLYTAIALLDLRYLDGPAAPEEAFGCPAVIEHLRAHDEGRRFVAALFEGHRQRVARHGETVFLLEPDVKSGEGGLRDLNCLAWAARVRWQIDVRHQSLPDVGWTEEHVEAYNRRLDSLLSLRNRLHLIRGRKQDRLTFREQETLVRLSLRASADDDLQAMLSHLEADPPDETERAALYPAIESTMADYYRRARRIATACERCLRRWTVDEDQLHRRQGPFELRGERLSMADDTELDDHLIFDALVLAGQYDLLLDPRLEADIEARVGDWPAGDDCPRKLAARMRQLLVAPDGSWRTSQRLLELGILSKVVPEFDPLICHVQHDLYHIYTTDMHSLKCLEKGRSLLGQQNFEPQWPFFSHLARQIDDPETLLLACLFHDIGKNRGGNHSERGAVMMETVGPRLGLDEKTNERLVFLVRHHLDLSTTSRRRDISDPGIVEELASRIGTVECLNQLTVLTFCDMSTVGPEVMNDWNASLLTELYHYLREVLEEGPRQLDGDDDDELRRQKRAELLSIIAGEPDLNADECDPFIDDLPADHLLDTHPAALLRQYRTFCRAIAEPENIAVCCTPLPDRGVTEVIVCAPDKPGTLAKIAGAIASSGVNIMAADIVTTARNQTLDIFRIAHFNPRAVPPAQPRPVEGTRRLDRIRQRIIDVLCGSIDVQELLDQRRGERRLDPRLVPSVATEVRVDPDASEHYTVIEVRAPDRLGLLHSIANTLLECRVNTRVSRIDSLGSQAIDTFYFEEWEGGPLSPERVEEVVQALRTTLAEDD